MARKFDTEDNGMVSMSEARFRAQDVLLTLAGYDYKHELKRLAKTHDNFTLKRVIIEIALEFSEQGMKEESRKMFDIISGF